MQLEPRKDRARRFSSRFTAVCYALQVIIFAAAFIALHYHLTGVDPDLPSDRAILQYLGGFAAILYGGVFLLVLLRWSLQLLLLAIEGPRSRG
jgi:Na+/proline symporter